MDNHEKENALNIVTEERTYHIYAESPEDARYIIYITIFYTNICIVSASARTMSGDKGPPCGCNWYCSNSPFD